MAKKKRSWLAKLIFPQPKHRARPRVQGFRNCTIEQLETRSLLSGHTFLTLSQLLTKMTPNPQPSGDLPADMSQVQTLTTYTASALPPDMPGIPEIHDFVVGLEAVYSDIADNPAARPAFWVQTAPAGNKCQVFLDDNGMLITQWTIDWGDGTTPQTIGPAPWVVHNYSTAGDYTVTVTANGMDGTYTADGVDPPISPDAPMLHVAGPQTVAAGQTFSLDNLASFISQDAPTSLPDGATTDATDFNYSIDWGDGSTPFTGISVGVIARGGRGAPFVGALMSNAGDGPLEHVYSDPGTYNLNVTVTTDTTIPLSDTQTIPITVVQLAPTIIVSSTPIMAYTCSEGDSVTFSAGGTVDAALTDTVAYNWSISDSSGNVVTQSTDPNLSFTFPSADTYTVSLVTAVDNIQSAPTTATITVNPVAATIDTIPDATVAVGQPFNLSTAFTDPNPNDTHIVSIDWGDGGPTDYGAQVSEESSDAITTTPGTISDSYVYTTATSGTSNMVTVTLTDSEGVPSVKTFAVTVVSAATVSLGSFTANSGGSLLQVPYSITGTAAPFTIGIYSSPDGTTPDQLLASIAVDGTSFPLTGTHTATVAPAFDDIPSNYHLIAVTDGNSGSTQSTVEFAGGIFVAASKTADPPQKIIYVFGGASGDTVAIHGLGAGGSANKVVLNSTTSLTIDGSITGIHVRGESGTDDFEVDSDVTLPLWLFGGAGTTTINDAGSGADFLAAGDGATTITHSGSGDAAISGGTAQTTITTGPGNDTINFGTGATILNEANGQSSPEILDDSNGSHGGITNAYTESAGSGWSPSSPTSGFNQGERVNDGSHPTATATWAFGNLDPTAYYDVYVTWSPIAGAATSAQYGVHDGSSLSSSAIGPIGIGSIPTFNQNQSPADYQTAETIWRSLGVFHATSGSLAVGLTAGSSGMALADAVMIVPHMSPPLTNLSFATGQGIAVDENGNFAVTYTIDGEDSAPFSIGIYGSPDGVQPVTLLQTYAVDDPTLLTGGGAVHTLSIAPDLGDASSSHYLFAMLDCNQETYEMSKADNRSAALSGIFQNSDGGLAVLRGGSVDEGITITQDPSTGTITLTINGTSQQFAGVTSIQILTSDGNDTVDASGLDTPVTIYAGAGSDNIIGGRGNNQLYGGAGSDILDGSNGQNNWIQAGPGGGIIRGGNGNDWLYGGGGTNYIFGGDGSEVIHGGSGTNYIHGGSGLDDLFGGTGRNFIYGNGANDVLAGGGGNNYIQPNYLYPPYDLASVEVKDSNDAPTFDGNMNAVGATSDGDARSVDPAPDDTVAVGDPTRIGYGGEWDFNAFDSGVRLGESGTTPVAVYVTWDPANTTLDGSQWTADACYSVYINGSQVYSVDGINQANACTDHDSPEQGDRNWLRLGVWNVGAAALNTITVYLTDNSYQTGDRVCVGDAMIHPIWPTVNIRADLDGTKTFGEKDDFLAACNPASIPVEGDGARLKLQVAASIENLYYSISGATSGDWKAVVPNVDGLNFWTSQTGGMPMTPDGSQNIIDSAFSQSGSGAFTGTYKEYSGTVFESVNPTSMLATEESRGGSVVQTVAQAANPGLGSVMAQVGARVVQTPIRITRTLVNANGTPIAPPSLRNPSGASAGQWQIRGGNEARLRWKFQLDRPATESLWIIQQIKVTMPGFFGDTLQNFSTTYYELIGTVHEGQTQITGQNFDDTWFPPAPSVQVDPSLNPFSNFRFPHRVTAGKITFEGEVRAFPVNGASLSGVILNRFYDPADHGNTWLFYTGLQPNKPRASAGGATPPEVTPGVLLSIKNFNQPLSPTQSDLLKINYWSDKFVGAEARNRQWAFETETVQFSSLQVTAGGVNAFSTQFKNQNAGPGDLP